MLQGVSRWKILAWVSLVCVSSVACAQATELKAKFLPPEGKLLMFIGQDSDTISDYIKAVPEDNIEAVTLYTTIKHADPSKTLKAVFERANWQAGDVDFGYTLAESPKAALAIGLAFDACNDIDHAIEIAAGRYDKSIAALGEYLASIAPRKVFLRIGYEFDGMWNCYNPESYKQAYRKIVDGVKAQGADNVAMIWQSAAWPDPDGAGERAPLYDHRDPKHLSRWYPGDDYVDWVSLSTFYTDLSQWRYTPGDTPKRAQMGVLDFARKKAKPVFISEAAPQGFDIGELTRSPIQRNQAKPASAEEIWQSWFKPWFELIYDNQDVVRAVAYINTHWKTQPMWYCKPGIDAGKPGCNNGNWGDTRIQANPLIQSRWLVQVNDEKRWIQRGDY
ncbi:hypothetical protein [Paraferrimonas sedimenticola]|uniref:GH26 domain-containing protein n=1 Tax=Paraferrimonas sedimenticola TaxID=375674 RepID=A0AA37RVC1_9GAMM|nr:hypothetical protein [Paraferrimonas sedimenticola]GLP95903.1 hypothetical protein GCM10007895_12090 [Paraferrimonas sedimenticola]